MYTLDGTHTVFFALRRHRRLFGKLPVNGMFALYLRRRLGLRFCARLSMSSVRFRFSSQAGMAAAAFCSARRSTANIGGSIWALVCIRANVVEYNLRCVTHVLLCAQDFLPRVRRFPDDFPFFFFFAFLFAVSCVVYAAHVRRLPPYRSPDTPTSRGPILGHILVTTAANRRCPYTYIVILPQSSLPHADGLKGGMREHTRTRLRGTSQEECRRFESDHPLHVSINARLFIPDTTLC